MSDNPPETVEMFLALPIAPLGSRYLGEAFVKPLGSVRYAQDNDGIWWGIERIDRKYCRVMISAP